RAARRDAAAGRDRPRPRALVAGECVAGAGVPDEGLPRRAGGAARAALPAAAGAAVRGRASGRTGSAVPGPEPGLRRRPVPGLGANDGRGRGPARPLTGDGLPRRAAAVPDLGRAAFTGGVPRPPARW